MVIIRPATTVQHAELEALLARATLAAGENADALLQHPDALTLSPDAIAHTLVAMDGGRLLGFCTAVPGLEGRFELDAVFVEPSAWRRGIGRMLVLAVEKRAEEEGGTAISVVSGRHAVPFYEALRFLRSGISITRFGPAIRLLKRLVARA